MVKRDELLAAVENSAESLANFIAECKTQNTACLTETFGSCSRKQVEDVWEKTHGLVEGILHYNEESLDTAAVVRDLSHSVNCVVTMLSAMLHQKEIHIPGPALQVAVLLRDLLPSLPATEQKLKNSIAELFETWWKKNIPGREDLIISSFVYLVEKSIEPKLKHVMMDIKRVWSLHEVLSLIDLQSNTSEDFRNLLQRCFIYPHYLQQDEGLKFLAYVLSEEENFTSVLHTLIKEHLLTLNKSLHAKYGVVYFRAWQRLQGPQLVKFEQDCVQDLMYHAVCAHHTLFPALQKILHHFHVHKKQNGVDAMLLRLYEPFLWRSLQTANHKVRANATTLFFDVFPLQRPDMNVQETDNLLQKQFDLFQELLNDGFPNIRVLAVMGVFQVMKEYWEMIPQDTLRNLTVRLIQALSSEVGSADVREHVIKGLTLLLDNMLSHVFLNPLLSEIKNSLHDVSEKVRTAMMELLLKVKNLRTIKYWNIVPIEHLLARLAIDTEPVSKRIVKLLFTSFLPLEAQSHVQVERCIVLLEANPAGARQFFRYAQNHMSVNDTVKYMLTLCKAIVVDMKQRTREEGERGGSNSSEEENDDETDEDTSNDIMSTAVVRGMCETICILWTGRKEDLKKESNAALLKNLQKSFSYTLAEMMKVYSDPQIVSAVVQIAGFLPANYIPTISRKWLPKLRAMTSKNPPEDYSVLLETLVLSNRGLEVVELAMEWLNTVLGQTNTPQATKARKKKICFVDPTVPQPQLALDFLNYICQQAMTREKLIQNNLPECKAILELLKKTMEAIQAHLIGQQLKMADDAEKFLMSALTLYSHMLLLLHSTNPEEHPCIDEMIGLLSWADKHVLPCLSVKNEESDQTEMESDITGTQQKALAHSVIRSLLKIFNNMLLIGFADSAMCTQLVDFCSACVALDEELQLLPAVLLNLYQVTEFVKFLPQQNENDEPTEYNGNVIPNALSRIFVSIAGYVKNNPLQAPKLLASVKGHILELMKAVFNSLNLEDTVLVDIIGTVLAAILAELKFCSREHNLEEEPSIVTLPPLSCWLVDIVQRRTDILKYLVEEMTDCCDSGVVSDMHSCHSVVHIICAMAKLKKLPTELQDLYKVADRQTNIQLEQMAEEDRESHKETILALQNKMEQCKTLLAIEIPESPLSI